MENIKNKFNIGDKVVYLRDTATVLNIQYDFKDKRIQYLLDFGNHNKPEWLPECDCKKFSDLLDEGIKSLIYSFIEFYGGKKPSYLYKTISNELVIVWIDDNIHIDIKILEDDRLEKLVAYENYYYEDLGL